MPAKKLPWRTIITSSHEQVGRLNREEVRKAILEVKALREARAARERRPRRGSGRQAGDAASPERRRATSAAYS